MSDLHSTTSKFLEWKFSRISGEVLNLGPICLKLDFTYKIWNINVKLVLRVSKLTDVQISKYIWQDFYFGTIFAQILISMVLKWLI